jgi:hypothetical protein
MGFLRGDKLKLPRLDPNQVFETGANLADKVFQRQGQLFKQGVSQAGELAGDAATKALDINIAALPRIREAQQQFNPELFSGIAEQERLATGDLATRLEQEASDRLGTGLTFDEERSLREASRGAFTSRGLFRSNPALLDEIVRRRQADRSARMQNAMFAQNVIGARQQFLQQPIMNRQQLFLDPRNATGITAGSLMQSGVGLGQGALSLGLGISESAAMQNLQAQQAEAAANRRKGALGKIIGGVGAAVGGIFGGPMGAQAGASAGSALGGMFERPGAEGGGFSLPGLGAGSGGFGGGMMNFGSLFGGGGSQKMSPAPFLSSPSTPMSPLNF